MTLKIRQLNKILFLSQCILFLGEVHQVWKRIHFLFTFLGVQLYKEEDITHTFIINKLKHT